MRINRLIGCVPWIRRLHFHEVGDHLGPQNAAVLVGELNGSVSIIRSLARLDSHIKFTWRIEIEELAEIFFLFSSEKEGETVKSETFSAVFSVFIRGRKIFARASGFSRLENQACMKLGLD